MIKNIHKNVWILSLLLISAFIFSFSLVKPDGPKAGHTNSPADGKNCTECHGGTAQNAASDFITSDIPTEGYTAGNTYNFTVKVNGSGRKGFQISPQDGSGNLMGNLQAGAGNNINNTKYVNQNAPKTDAVATWNFKWTAPATGVGDITFYGAYVASKPNVFVGTHTVKQATSSSIQKQNRINQLYPNPVANVLNIDFDNELSENAQIRLIAIDGSGIEKITGFENSKNIQVNIPENLSNGYYILEIQNGERYIHKKVLIKR